MSAIWATCFVVSDAVKQNVPRDGCNGSRCCSTAASLVVRYTAQRAERIVFVEATNCRSLASQMSRRILQHRIETPAVSSPGELMMTFSTSARRGLLLQRFGEIVGALAQLVEQPRVLDGDDGLRGKVLNQLNLLVGERAHFLCGR